MAVGFMDSFDHWASADFLAKWTANFGTAPVPVTSTLYARGTGQGMAFSSGNVGRGIYKTVWAGGSATVTMGAACYFISSPSTTGIIFAFMDGSAEQCSVRGDAAGKLTVQRGTTVLATSTNSVSLNTWYWVEFRATISSTVGQYELRVNGTATGWVPTSAANKDTAVSANDYATGVCLSSSSTSALQVYYDDFYALDSSGSVNTTFLGDGKVFVAHPVAAGNYAQWTSNGGPNFGNVADAPYYDADTSFNQSATANQIDSHIYEDVPASTGAIAAIQHCIWAKKDVGAARTIAAFQRSSATDYVGTTQSVGTSYALLLEVKETNPDTGVAWTIAGFNAAEWGVKEIS